MNPLWPEAGAQGRCGDCVWRFVGGRGKAVPRCRRHDGARIDEDWPACPAFEAALDCLACGACCREAYGAVEVSRRDPFVKAHPERVDKRRARWEVFRRGERCACLQGDGPYTCVVYADRPQTCRDFEQGGENCVIARRRVGLTR